MTRHTGAVWAGGLLPAGVIHVFSTFQNPEEQHMDTQAVATAGRQNGMLVRRVLGAIAA